MFGCVEKIYSRIGYLTSNWKMSKRKKEKEEIEPLKKKQKKDETPKKRGRKKKVPEIEEDVVEVINVDDNNQKILELDTNPEVEEVSTPKIDKNTEILEEKSSENKRKSSKKKIEKEFTEEILAKVPNWKIQLESKKEYIFPTENNLKVQVGKKKETLVPYHFLQLSKKRYILNANGPVWALEWIRSKEQQYFCVGTYQKNEHHLSGVKYSGKSLVDIYTIENEIPKWYTTLEFDHGPIQSIKSYPSICEDDQRLGIIAIAFLDGTFGVYSVPKDRGLLKLKGFEDNNENYSSTAVSWSPNGKYFSSGYGNGNVKLFKVDSESLEISLIPCYEFKAQNSQVRSIHFSYVQENIILTCGNDHYLHWWDIRYPFYHIAKWTSSSTWTTQALFSKFNNSFICSNHDGCVKQFDFKNEKEMILNTIVQEYCPVWDFSVGSNDDSIIFCCTDGCIYSREILTRKKKYEDLSKKIFQYQMKDDVILIKNEKIEKRVFEEDYSLNRIAYHPSNSEELRHKFICGGSKGFIILMENK